MSEALIPMTATELLARLRRHYLPPQPLPGAARKATDVLDDRGAA
jgi:hypothetical protein